MKIVVLAGGISTERAVSLVTGTGVCRALRENGHRAILVDLFLGLEEVPADLETLFDAPDGLCPDAKIEVEAPDLETVKRGRKDQGPSHIGPHVLDICQKADLVFLGLHGMDGEDGRIQAALDLLGVPYTGAAVETCPADVPPAVMQAAGELALRTHRALGLEVYSRTDMILDKDGNLWVLEANSLPGMTPNSFVPKEAAAVGMSYNQLCEEIVRLSCDVKRRG